jgi:Phage integrase family
MKLPLSYQPAVERLIAKADERAAAEGQWAEEWDGAQLVFTTATGRPIDASNLRRYFRQACERAGIGRWTPYEMRHSAASLMSAAGCRSNTWPTCSDTTARAWPRSSTATCSPPPSRPAPRRCTRCSPTTTGSPTATFAPLMAPLAIPARPVAVGIPADALVTPGGDDGTRYSPWSAVMVGATVGATAPAVPSVGRSSQVVGAPCDRVGSIWHVCGTSDLLPLPGDGPAPVRRYGIWEAPCQTQTRDEDRPEGVRAQYSTR